MSDNYSNYSKRPVGLVEQTYHSHADSFYIREMKKYGVRTVLDVGAGDGRLADILRAEGFQVTCIETAKGSCDVLESKGHEVFRGSFQQFEADPKSFDCVLHSYGVLCHIKDLEVAMEKTERMCKKLILGWVSNKKQLQLFLGLPYSEYKETTNPEGFPTRLVSKLQWGDEYEGEIQSFDYYHLKEVFDKVEPFPTILFALPWDETDPDRVKAAYQMDKSHPNRDFCSGFLVERVL